MNARRLILLTVFAAGLLAAGGLAVVACNPDWQTCEDDLDCLILCDCGTAGTVTVGPYPCRAGTCGARHFEDLDCVRPCQNVWILGDDDTSVWPDDDDSSGADDDDSSSQDDDSAEVDDDDDSAGG